MAFDWKDLGKTIFDHAPEIGVALGSVIPGAGTVAGGTLGTGIKTLASLFGLSESAKPEEIQAAIMADSQAALKLKMADMDFAIKNREIDIAELKEMNSTYIEELRAKTIPWVDALHKMGRQNMNYLTLIVAGIAMACGHVFTQWDVLILTGAPAVYTIAKGKGTQANGK